MLAANFETETDRTNYSVEHRGIFTSDRVEMKHTHNDLALTF